MNKTKGKTGKHGEAIFDSSYVKLSQLTREKLTREKLEAFMKENPNLISIVPAEKVRDSMNKLKGFMKTNPVGKQILEADEQLLKQIENRKARKLKSRKRVE